MNLSKLVEASNANASVAASDLEKTKKGRVMFEFLGNGHKKHSDLTILAQLGFNSLGVIYRSGRDRVYVGMYENQPVLIDVVRIGFAPKDSGHYRAPLTARMSIPPLYQ